MRLSVDTFVASVDAAVSAAAQVATSSSIARDLDDRALIAAQTSLAVARRDLEASASLLAGEIAHRSRRETGFSGLAQREGFATPQALVQHATGSTASEALTLVRVGAIVHSSLIDEASVSAAPVSEPWLIAVGTAVASGYLSVAAASAIRNGLGIANDDVSAAALVTAATSLIDAASELNADQLYRRARDTRDDLDDEGIASRERDRRKLRSFRRWRKPDGMTRYTWELDPEGAALVDGVYDQISSPRRGGPRMVDKAEQARAEAIVNDSRTTEQLISDGFLALLDIAVATDPRQIIGGARPAVRVLVTAVDLAARRGHGRIEGHADPISIETVERITCDVGIVPIAFSEDGQAVNVGHNQRLFTRKQRIALAVRDGGCRWTGCERPPGWSEAHHVKHWKRDHGETNLDNGILLCRYHHLLLHDNHWEIERRSAEYFLVPPASIDPARTPRPLPSKSAALRDLLSERPA